MLGKGIYILAEISRLTEIHPARVRSWLKQRNNGSGHSPLFSSDYMPADGDYASSFLDLIDVLIAGQFRDKYQVSMSVVKKAHRVLKEELNTDHPFCHSDLHTDGKNIFTLAANKVGDKILSEVVSHQQFFIHVLEPLSHIDYEDASKLAKRWRIAQGIVVDPSISLGKPVVEGTGTTTHVIANQYYANNQETSLVADLYGISDQDVHNAVSFEDRYWGRQVA